MLSCYGQRVEITNMNLKMNLPLKIYDQELNSNFLLKEKSRGVVLDFPLGLRIQIGESYRNTVQNQSSGGIL